MKACLLGELLVAMSERGVCLIAMGDDPNALIADLERRFRDLEREAERDRPQAS